jgi:sporulation-control protein spo0M
MQRNDGRTVSLTTSISSDAEPLGQSSEDPIVLLIPLDTPLTVSGAKIALRPDLAAQSGQ